MNQDQKIDNIYEFRGIRWIYVCVSLRKKYESQR